MLWMSQRRKMCAADTGSNMSETNGRKTGEKQTQGGVDKYQQTGRGLHVNYFLFSDMKDGCVNMTAWSW